MNYKLKNAINNVYNVCDSLDKTQFGALRTGSNSSSRDILRMELAKFLIYLSNSDGVYSWQESEFINDYLDYQINETEAKRLLEDRSIFHYEFGITPPSMLKRFVNADNAVYDSKGTIESPASELILRLYEAVGKEFLACDLNSTDEEVADLTIFLTFMRNYISDNLKSKQNNNFSIKTTNSHVNIESESTEDSLEELLQELNSLTGLDAVKKEVNSLINLIQIRRLREERGLKQMPLSLHLVFSGNPGTGKTTVARLLAKIYHKLGILSSGHLTEVDRSGLVAGYVGQTAIKVQEVLKESLGGILFIDEAYSLVVNKGENDFGFEAVDTLLKGMEDNRDDLIVVVAGYPDLMNEFLDSNPGLRSRFNKFINFADYTPNELVSIFNSMCYKAEYTATEDCMLYVKKYFEQQYLMRNINFANGRDVRNFFEIAMVNQANRLSNKANITDEELSQFVLSDVENIVL